MDFTAIFQRTAVYVLQQSRPLVLNVRYNPNGGCLQPRACG